MTAGILIGALATSIFQSDPDLIKKSVSPSEPTTPQPEEENTSHPPKPRFDFYTLLKETEVIVPEHEENGATKPTTPPADTPPVTAADKTPASQTTTVKQTSKQTTSTSESEPTQPAAEVDFETVYVLQAGSFKQYADADSVRVRLLLLNMQANIEKVTTANNETWHRVLIGPFNSKAESSKARTTLTQNGIDSIQLKRRL